MTSLREIIREYRDIVEGKFVEVEAAKRKLDLLIDLQKIKNKRVRCEKLTGDDIQRAMNFLCWGSFAGCCAPAKGCPFHLAVCDALGLDPKEVWEAKRRAVDELCRLTLTPL